MTDPFSSPEAALDALRKDATPICGDAAMDACEACGAWLIETDDYVSDDYGVSGCWAAMVDSPAQQNRPCYAYRVGKPDARKPPLTPDLS